MDGVQKQLAIDGNREPDLDVNGWWWAMAILGVAIVVLFGFYFCIDLNRGLIPRTDACADHWRSWEMGAVLWAILFGIYYFLRFPQLQDEMHTKIICTLIFLGSIVANVLAAYFIMKKPAVWHVGAVIAGSILFMAADYFLYKWLDNDRQKCSFFEGLLLADLPMTAGLVILMAYLLIHRNDGHSHEDMEAFAGGAISFQLIAANVIFVLSQGGFIRWVWVKEGGDKKSNSRERIKTPLEQNLWAGTALTCGLVGLLVPLIRRIDGSWSLWSGFGIALIAIITGLFGMRTARQHPEGVCRSLAIFAVILGGVGITAPMWVKPQKAMFFATAEKLPGVPAKLVKERVTAVALSPDGSIVARGSDTEETLKIFDARSGELIEKKNVDGPILALAFSPDGKTLASGGKNLTLMLWDTDDWQYHMIRNAEDRHAGLPDEEVERNDDHALDVHCLAFSPEGRLLAGGVSDNSIRFWVTEKEKKNMLDTARKHDGAVHTLAFSADGKWLVSGGENKVTRWGVAKKWLVSDSHQDEDHKELLDADIDDEVPHDVGTRVVKSVAITRHGEAWAAGLDDGTVLVWDNSNARQRRFEGESKEPVLALRFSDDNLVLASASRNPGVTLWDTQLGRQKALLQVSGAATVMDFSLDAAALAGGSDGGTLTVWWAH